MSAACMRLDFGITVVRIESSAMEINPVVVEIQTPPVTGFEIIVKM